MVTSIRRRLLYSYATLIALLLVFLVLAAGIRTLKQRIDVDRNTLLLAKSNWNQLQISLTNIVSNWQDGDAVVEFSRRYEMLDEQVRELNQTIATQAMYPDPLQTKIASLTKVWAMARQHLILVISHVEHPAFQEVREVVGRRIGVQSLNTLRAELYATSDDAEKRIAYQISTLIGLVEFFPIYSDTVNRVFDTILSDAEMLQRRMARFESVSIAVFLFVFLVSAVLLSVRFSDALSRPIVRVSRRLNAFMGRNASVALGHGQDEVRTLARTVEHMIRHYTKLSDQARRLASGDVAAFARTARAEGVVGSSLRDIASYFRELAGTSTRIRRGDYGARVQPRSSNDILADNINSMADVILERISTLRGVFEGVDEGIIVVAPDRRVVEYNRRLPRMLGMNEVEPKAPLPDVVRRLPEALGDLVDTAFNGVSDGEHFRTLRGASGHSIPVRIHARRLEPLEGDSIKVMFLMSNESWRERAKRERERLKAHATEAELRALRAQINPHFFFNALNTIAYLVETNGENAVATIETLADLFRYTLAATRNDRVPLQEELAQIQRYVDIERLRYGDRLRYFSDTGSIRADDRIPPMLVQPIVENAVRYGQDHTGNIDINLVVRRENDALHIQVYDAGVQSVVIDTIMNGGGTGLKNVNLRLKTLYREQLHFRRLEPHGLVVGMRVPTR